MKLRKILIISGAVLVAAGIAGFTIVRAQSGYTKVLTAKVVRQNLVSIVSGTGQIKPKTYVNIGATSFGRITHLYVKEGDHVKQGQVLATVEPFGARVVDVSVDSLVVEATGDSAKLEAMLRVLEPRLVSCPDRGYGPFVTSAMLCAVASVSCSVWL